MKKHNFSSGPSILPQEVFQEAAKAIVDYDNSGLSILEISHRSTAFTAILEETESLVRELINIDDRYAVLFLTGGASSQFYMSPLNLLAGHQKAGFIDTGTWSVKAIKEAQQYGQISVIASSKNQNYNYVPKEYTIPEGLAYLHFTSNNTIYGTQFHEWPEIDTPLVGDMSSDIFTKPFDVSRFSLIYAGAQKNMGPAGVTLVIVRKDILGKTERTIPSMLDYRNHIAKNSAFNTPPVYAIYVSMLNLRWLKKQGGIPVMNQLSQEKANLFYNELDQNPCFNGHTVTEDRSKINATFRMSPEYSALENQFIEAFEAAGCVNVKGHRSVGGFRASMYNAMNIESVKVLVEVMNDFALKNG